MSNPRKRSVIDMAVQPPEAPSSTGIPNFNVQINEDDGMAYMMDKKLPLGIARKVISETEKCPMRFFIMDDSGSMSISDGSRLVEAGAGYAQVQCSRWEEMTSSAEFHLSLSKHLNAPCEFRFLNNLVPKRTGIRELDPDGVNDREIRKVLEWSPSGATPLCRHVTEVIHEIRAREKQIREAGQHVSVVIMCDGSPSDGNIAQIMKPLEHLPCIVVVRLCTNDERIVDYWNNIDRQLEINLDILDDPIGEAFECKSSNPWLNYGHPLHRMREWGVHIRELDFLDETLLTATQMVNFLCILFDAKKADFPLPGVDYNEFEKVVQEKLRHLDQIYNPVTRKLEPWINLSHLRRCYGPPGCCSVA